MSTSYIAIYQTNITPDRNALVDNLEDYLATCTKQYESNEFQYQKIALDMSIKIPVGQAFNTYAIGNYVKIRQDAKNHYFFIMSSNWTAVGVITLNLSLDTVNTYNGDYEWSAKTKILREHKDRFWSKDKLIAGQSNTLHKVIDEVSEGLNPVLVQSEDTAITDSNAPVDSRYYLIYRTPDDITTSNQALECALVAKDQVSIYAGSSVTTITWGPSDLQSNIWYYYTYNDNYSNIPGQIKIGNYSYSTNATSNYMVIFYKKANNHIYYKIISNTGDETVPETQATGSDQVIFKPVSKLVRYGAAIIDTWTIMHYPYIPLNVGSKYLAQLKNYDLTDSKICKIIELPYLPAGFEWNGDALDTIPDGWELNGKNELILSTLSNEFMRYLGPYYINELEETVDLTNTAASAINKDKKYESKLLHSDLFNLKMNYDSFNIPILLERYHNYHNNQYVKFIELYYKQSNTVNSNLLFKWTTANETNYTYSHLGDYDNYLISTRNNEAVQYSNNYINYMRTDYNYDRKNANLQAVSNAINTSANIAGMFLTGGATGGLKAAMRLKYGLSGATAGLNVLSSSMQSELNIQQKIDNAKVQATAVAGANDLDLLNEYNGNQLHMIKYKPSERIENDLFNFFYLYGYKSDLLGVPVTNTRLWFNYIQCEPVFTNESNDDTYKEILDDIKGRYQVGVTRYHKVNNSWDWSQTHENWETNLL